MVDSSSSGSSFFLIGSMKIEWCLLPLLGPIHYQRSLVKVNLFLVKINQLEEHTSSHGVHIVPDYV